MAIQRHFLINSVEYDMCCYCGTSQNLVVMVCGALFLLNSPRTIKDRGKGYRLMATKDHIAVALDVLNGPLSFKFMEIEAMKQSHAASSRCRTLLHNRWQRIFWSSALFSPGCIMRREVTLIGTQPSNTAPKCNICSNFYGQLGQI